MTENATKLSEGSILFLKHVLFFDDDDDPMYFYHYVMHKLVPNLDAGFSLVMLSLFDESI